MEELYRCFQDLQELLPIQHQEGAVTSIFRQWDLPYRSTADFEALMYSLAGEIGRREGNRSLLLRLEKQKKERGARNKARALHGILLEGKMPPGIDSVDKLAELEEPLTEAVKWSYGFLEQLASGGKFSAPLFFSPETVAGEYWEGFLYFYHLKEKKIIFELGISSNPYNSGRDCWPLAEGHPWGFEFHLKSPQDFELYLAQDSIIKHKGDWNGTSMPDFLATIQDAMRTFHPFRRRYLQYAGTILHLPRILNSGTSRSVNEADEEVRDFFSRQDNKKKEGSGQENRIT